MSMLLDNLTTIATDLLPVFLIFTEWITCYIQKYTLYSKLGINIFKAIVLVVTTFYVGYLLLVKKQIYRSSNNIITFLIRSLVLSVVLIYIIYLLWEIKHGYYDNQQCNPTPHAAPSV